MMMKNSHDKPAIITNQFCPDCKTWMLSWWKGDCRRCQRAAEDARLSEAAPVVPSALCA